MACAQGRVRRMKKSITQSGEQVQRDVCEEPNKHGSILDCASLLALSNFRAVPQRQRTAAVQNLAEKSVHSLLLTVLINHPTQRGQFAEGSPAILVANPILIGHSMLQAIEVRSEFTDLHALTSHFVQLVFHRLSAVTERAVWVHGPKCNSLNRNADKLCD